MYIIFFLKNYIWEAKKSFEIHEDYLEGHSGPGLVGRKSKFESIVALTKINN